VPQGIWRNRRARSRCRAGDGLTRAADLRECFDHLVERVSFLQARIIPNGLDHTTTARDEPRTRTVARACLIARKKDSHPFGFDLMVI
jgi:hypothetical protein